MAYIRGGLYLGGGLYSGGLIFRGKFVLVIRGAYIWGVLYSGFYGILCKNVPISLEKTFEAKYKCKF